MAQTTWKPAAVGGLIPILLAASSIMAHAQTPAPATASPWSVEFGFGWDNGISGNINSSGIGQINNQAVVITDNSYEDVYGVGFHMLFGGGYALSDETELRGIFTWQSLDASQVVPIGDIGVSNLYGTYSDYQAFSVDFGVRRYVNVSSTLRAYGEGTAGLGFIDKTDITLAAPGANFVGTVNDFYDDTAAFAAGANVGLLIKTGGHVDVFGQLGLRWMSGLDEIDDLADNGLGGINDQSSRWTLPLVGGIRYSF